MDDKLVKLRQAITESLRVQREGAESVPYIDVSHHLVDAASRQNHAIFGRRGCGKTLLLHHSTRQLPADVRAVYLNCEDFKNHTFPDVLIEILDAVFRELAGHLTGWFGKKKKSRQVIEGIRKELASYLSEPDESSEAVRERNTTDASREGQVGVQAGKATLGGAFGKSSQTELQKEYERHHSKIGKLNTWLPKLKASIREFFDLSTDVKAVVVQIDDYYHLRRQDQPSVMDYIHRLCKDVPLFFKVATLRHSSILYAERSGQPIGAQERHDYQPINIDFTLRDFPKTENQIMQIFREYAGRVGLSDSDLDGLFKGEGFRRLVLAGGGVPRDCLSLFLEALVNVQHGDGRIGKDDVRQLSRPSFERRIEELKQDSQAGEEDVLLRGVYAVREFCIDRKSNVFFIPEALLQQNDSVRDLIHRLLDYRIIHSISPAMTHKSRAGSFSAFVVDIGCYAHLRKLQGKLHEYDLAAQGVREEIRSAPILDEDVLEALFESAPEGVEAMLLSDEPEAAGAS